MSTVTLTWPQLILLLLAVLAVYGLEMAFFYWRLRRHNFADHFAQVRLLQLEQQVQALQRQLYPEPLPSIPLTAPLSDELEPDELESYAEDEGRQEAAAGSSADAFETVTPETGASYNRAIDLARHGADASILSRDCGLTRGEADLIVSLYGPRRR